MRNLTVPLVAALVGCGPSGPLQNVGEPPCGLVPLALEASEGGRVRAALASDPAGARFALLSAPAGWEVRLDDGALAARIPYGSTGDFALKVSVQCESRSVDAELPVTVRALRWMPVAAWSGGDGPAAR